MPCDTAISDLEWPPAPPPGVIDFSRSRCLAFLQVSERSSHQFCDEILGRKSSALPALMLTTAKRSARKGGQDRAWPLVKGAGSFVDDPLKVAGIAVLLLLPMGVGFMQLEVALR
ncbi:MAG: hypothetical protein CM15mP128_1160 [Methanobacteriota archaeon]|nr:MAG: hypothetical protein CM15mP128_1160 [Euryarchaeota archaeon]